MRKLKEYEWYTLQIHDDGLFKNARFSDINSVHNWAEECIDRSVSSEYCIEIHAHPKDVLKDKAYETAKTMLGEMHETHCIELNIYDADIMYFSNDSVNDFAKFLQRFYDSDMYNHKSIVLEKQKFTLNR